MYFRSSVYNSAVSPQGVWKLAKYGREQSGKPKPIPKFPPLKKPDGSMAETFNDKIDALRGAFFPPPPEADLVDIEGAEYPAPLTISRTVTQVMVTKAINRPKKDKAPGPNGIPNRFLSIVAAPFAGVFTHLFQACLDVGYHPHKFKEAKTIILKKPSKPDYSEVKAY